MKPLSDRTLERFLLGDLPRSERELVERASAEDPQVAARLAALKASDAEILERYPPAMMAARLHDRLDRDETRFRRLRGLSFALPGAVLAFALVAVLVPLRQGGFEATRVKGLDARLVLHRKAGSAIEALVPGGRAAGGDVLQISYVAGGAPYGAILSIDGAGAVTWHLPPAAGSRLQSPALEPSGEVPLGFAYELDNAPAFERFFFLTSRKPFALDRIETEAKRLASAATARTEPLRVDRGVDQTSFLLLKEARR